MKIFREVLLLFGVYYIGEGIAQVTHIPIPGNLVGMLILLLLLCLRIIKLEHIGTISDFLLGHMPFFFIPAGVALMTSFAIISNIWIQIFIVCLLTTFVTMGVSGFSVQWFMRKKGDK